MLAIYRSLLIMLTTCAPFVRSYFKISALSKLTRAFPTKNFCSVANKAVEASTSVVPKLSSDPIEILEIRVGKIVEVVKHPEADSLYVEKVDLGEVSGPRTIVSGLVEYCSADQLLNSDVVVLCNLKPRALKGIMSQGMLLCASNKAESKVQPLKPPVGVHPGELVGFTGYTILPVEAGNRATKAFAKICEEFFVDDNMQATYKGVPFITSMGPIASTIKGPIS